MVKKIVPIVALLAILGGAYKFVLAKPAAATALPRRRPRATAPWLRKALSATSSRIP